MKAPDPVTHRYNCTQRQSHTVTHVPAGHMAGVVCVTYTYTCSLLVHRCLCFEAYTCSSLQLLQVAFLIAKTDKKLGLELLIRRCVEFPASAMQLTVGWICSTIDAHKSKKPITKGACMAPRFLSTTYTMSCVGSLCSTPLCCCLRLVSDRFIVLPHLYKR